MGAHSDTGRLTGLPGRDIQNGSVVAYLPYESKRFLGSPGIAIRDDGGWVMSHDIFGKDSDTSLTYLHESLDHGRSWTAIAQIHGAFWSSLFTYRDELYLLGTESEYGALVIRRSTDGGHTWTEPDSSRRGRLTDSGRFHTAPVPLVEYKGRLWRGYERLTNDGSEWGHFAAGLMSIDADADLLDAAAWALTPAVPVPEDLYAAGVQSWLEGNAVVAPTGGVVDVLRAHRWTDGHQSCVVLRADAPDSPLVPAAESLRPMPGGGSKFVIRRDELSGVYWSVVNTPLYDSSPTLKLRARNTLSLAWSRDLRDWQVVQMLLHHPDDTVHGYQYADWLVDGDDLIVAVRTAHDIDGHNAHNYHDSNLITVHRVSDFRRHAT